MTILEGFGKKVRQVGLGAMLVGVMSMSLVACGGDAATNTPAGTDATATSAPANGGTGSGTMVESAVTLTEWSVNPSEGEVAAGKVRFTVANTGKFSHNSVRLEGANEVGRTPNFTSADGPKVLEVDLKPGSYTVLCDIIGHPEKGMMGKLTVK